MSTSVSRTPGVYAAGTYKVDGAAIDSSGNTVKCSFTVTVLTDTTPPVVACPGNIIASTWPRQNYAIIDWPTPTATGSFLIQRVAVFILSCPIVKSFWFNHVLLTNTR